MCVADSSISASEEGLIFTLPSNETHLWNCKILALTNTSVRQAKFICN